VLPFSVPHRLHCYCVVENVILPQGKGCSISSKFARLPRRHDATLHPPNQRYCKLTVPSNDQLARAAFAYRFALRHLNTTLAHSPSLLRRWLSHQNTSCSSLSWRWCSCPAKRMLSALVISPVSQRLRVKIGAMEILRICLRQSRVYEATNGTRE